MRCDGADFWDTYNTTYKAAQYVQSKQKPLLLHVVNLPRLNAHSSAADYKFDLDQPDPLLAFGEALVKMEVLESSDIVVRVKGSGQDYFRHHDLGKIMTEENEYLTKMETQIRAEPDPPAASIFEYIRAPFPDSC